MTNHPLHRAILDELDAALATVDARALEALEARIAAARRVFVAGAGRSGLMLRAFAMRLMHAGLVAHVAGDVTTPAFGQGDLLVIGSGSGETSSLVGMARKARDVGGELALVTIVPESTIGRLADPVVRIGAPSPKAARSPAPSARSIQPMGSLFEQALLLLLDGVVARLVATRGASPEALFARHANLE